jgi:putative transposase
MKYRRSHAKGATYFFTVVTYKRKKILCEDENVKLIREAFKRISTQMPFKIDAFVILPDHIHCIWTLPEGDSDFSTRWRQIKAYFTRNCNEKYKDLRSASMKKRNAQAIWQRRFWEHQIRDERDFTAHVDYIHYNPVKHGLVKNPVDWEFSTFQRYVKEGIYTEDWGANEDIKFEENVGNE